MSITRSIALAAAISSMGIPAFSQAPDRPPAPAAKGEREKNEVEACKLYAVGAMQQKKGLYLSALKTLEECVRLDAEAIPPRRLLAALYLSVGRPDDALAMAKSVTERDANDFEGWQRYADQLYDLGRNKEAIAALLRSTNCSSAANYSQQLLVNLSRLANWNEKAIDYEAAEKARRRFLEVLEGNRDKFRASGFLNDADFLTEKADGWEKIGEACLKSGRPQPALQAFEKARDVFQGRDDAVARARLHRLHWHLAQVHAANGEPRDAIIHVQEYLRQIKTNSLEPYRLLVEQSRKIGEGAESPKRLEPYARREPDNLPLQLLLADQYGNYGRFSDAQDLYLKLLKKEVKPEIYQGLFRLYEKYDRMILALNKLDEYCIGLDKDKEKNEKKVEVPRKHVGAMMSVLAKNPSMVRKLVPLADAERINQFRPPNRNFDYRTYERIAGLLTRWQDLDAAERLLREALHDAGSQPWKNPLMASTDEVLLEVLMARHKYADVKSLSRERLLTSKENAFLYHYFLDLALAKLGEIDEALNVNKEAAGLAFSDGNKYASRTHRVSILEQDGRLDQALAECEKILKEFKSPRFTRGTSIRMAGLLSKLRRYDEGEKLLRRLYEQDPNDAQVCNSLGFELAERNKNLDEAEKLIRRALDLDRRARQDGTGDDEENAERFDQDNAAFLDSLAWVLFRKGKLAEARQILERALAQPDGKYSGEEWDHLGDVCFKIGDKPAAARAWRTAMQLYTEARLPKKDSRLPEAERKLKLVNPSEND